VNVRLPRTTTFILAIFFGCAFLAPLPFVVLMPGNSQNVLDQSGKEKTITLSKSAPTSLKIYPSDGDLYLLSILITNPAAYVTGVELLFSWMKSEYAVMPRSLFYKDGRSAEAEKAIAKTEMVDSQIVAKSVAIDYLAKYFPAPSMTAIKPSDLEISLAKTGGPSGGLAFAIGIVELLTKENILQGKSVAVTGTIDSRAKVGSIGGVAEKILAAKTAGATLILIPEANCDDLAPNLATIPSGIKVAAVGSLEEAMAALNSEDPRGCANLGA
jgi:PDZ domain-containing protein